ncbi:MAG: sigma-54 dependent transcriptional regulator [Thermodesulfobacteriota bacterium]|nr:sigma-54 dependent transcriptional regulator [Thermodesulfobacteriota bacterium]
MFPSVLIVDDEPSIVQSLEGLLSDEGFDVMTASNGYEALKVIETESPDIVLLDIWMPGIDGIETLKEIKESSPHIAVIMITGHGTIETAVSATKLGAFDFIEKPLSIDKVIVGINNALNFRRLEEENQYLRKKALSQSSIDGNSQPVSQLRQQINDAAPSNAWILISGENGTGKEMVARTIHTLSPRAEQQFVDVNCAAIPEASIDSELFGHEKGAFKGAGSKSIGKIELANDGTLFLDEISDMNLMTQAKLLRALQEQKIQRIGSNRPVSVDVRVIAATNKDLEAEIAAGRFREDLFYRLNVIPIEVPPLRDRQEDIPVLAEIFLKNQIQQNKTGEKHFSADAIELLCTYPWPGNVRELKNLIERLAIMVKKDTIDVADLPSPYNPNKAKASDPIESRLFSVSNLKEARTEFENTFIKIKLLQHDNNVTQTAKAIGVDRSYLHKKLKKMS